MSTEKSPIEARIAEALALSDDDDARLEQVQALHSTSGREAFEAAARLSSAADPTKRRLGVDILGQLGWAEDRPFLKETLPILIGLCEHDRDAGVVEAAIVALGHIGDRRGLKAVLRYADDESSDLRQAVAFALPSMLDSKPSATDPGIATLIALTKDVDDEVRDWATFGLGSQVDLDTVAVRSALADRIDDSDRDVAGEALVGLSKRKDPRAVEAVKRRLDAFDADMFVLEAASELRDPGLLASLVALRQGGWAGSSEEQEALEEVLTSVFHQEPEPNG